MACSAAFVVFHHLATIIDTILFLLKTTNSTNLLPPVHRPVHLSLMDVFLDLFVALVKN